MYLIEYVVEVVQNLIEGVIISPPSRQREIRFCSRREMRYNTGEKEQPDFGVVGLGSVGWALIHALHKHGLDYVGFDVKGDYNWKEILKAPFVFVCVSTPPNERFGIDAKNVTRVLERLAADNFKGVTIVKSTIPVGYMDRMAALYPNQHLVYMPEFLRERSPFTWSEDPDRLVVAGEAGDIRRVLRLFRWASGVPVVTTDWASAELGKLAHNSYIACKVSFTNEMERISRENTANPNDVMRIVWSDRRVRCSDHLTPGLGRYGGKCVPKDMNELRSRSGSKLLNAVLEVNESCPLPENVPRNLPIDVLIATRERPDELRRALKSVLLQTVQSRSISVICDPLPGEMRSIKKIIRDLDGLPKAVPLTNTRERNLSGAINTGLDHLTQSSIGGSYLALLDDDDWWEPRYLENCIKYANETGAEWVISGIVRHDRSHPDGWKQRIPRSISIDDFFVGNPNVQSSNLFVRLDSLNGIGGFDERLISTTDRDVCIRLLQSGTRYSVLYNHLVHHDALPGRDRLSAPGSRRKALGLRAFYEKYRREMSARQRAAFVKRSKDLFGVEIEPEGGLA